jgi:hypothetical protein
MAGQHERAVGAIVEPGVLVREDVVVDPVVHPQREPHLRRDQRHGAGEAARHDADDGEVDRVDLDGLAQQVGAVLADDGDRDVGARALLLRGERPAGRQPDAERVEEVRRHDVDERLARAVAAGDADHREVVRHQAVEDVIVVADVDVLGIGEGTVGVGAGVVVREDADELVGMPRQRLEQQRVDDREHRAVGADPQRQDGDSDRSEARSLAEGAGAEAQVLEQAGHGSQGREPDARSSRRGPEPVGPQEFLAHNRCCSP